jgi:hypothetical protein
VVLNELGVLVALRGIIEVNASEGLFCRKKAKGALKA